jgi:hypothetical protein
MFHNLWTRKHIALAVATVSLGCVAAILAIGLVYPEPIQHAALGPDWQCSRIAIVWTTCSRVKHAASASVRLAKESAKEPAKEPSREPACSRSRT